MTGKFFRNRISTLPYAIVLSSAILILALIAIKTFPHLRPTAKASPRQLTFEDRVAAQRAIETVYHQHRIWPKDNPQPKPALDAVMPESALRAKVEDYLRMSNALEKYWHRPVTGEQLQAEMERMARQTKQPEVLRELWAALGNDPMLIAECLARPLLAERMVRMRFDECVVQIGECNAPGLVDSSNPQSAIRNPQFDEWWQGVRTQMEMAVAAGGEYRLPEIAAAAPCGGDTWTATSTTGAPIGRQSHTAVWTGSEMIIWGGSISGDLNTGGRYNPATDSWTVTTTNGAPAARDSHTAVWTGSEIVVWGGYNAGPLNTGGRYNPATNSWTLTNITGAPGARYFHTAVWTGNEMIIWGGFRGTDINTGGRYNPVTDAWTITNTTGAPNARELHTAVWTGSEMIIWGGYANGVTNTGGRYNPTTDLWTTTNINGAPSGRINHTAVWTGSETIIWGGNSGSVYFGSGGRYNPATDSWIATTTIGAPNARTGHPAVWTGSEMIIWGGFGNSYFNTGSRYNPVRDLWTATAIIGAPSERTIPTAVWTGSEMIIWGGYNGNYLNTGGRDSIPSPLTISQTTQSFSANGGTGNIAVTAQGGCTWTAMSNANWLTITAGSSGAGNGAVSFSVAANTTGSARTGTLTIGGQTFTVTQSAAAPSIVRVVATNALSGGTVNVPIELVAQGNENSLAFSLTFDPARLSSPQAALGSGASGAALTVNANQAAQGRLGIIVSQPPGQVFAAGTRQILTVSFTVAAVTAATSTTAGFGDQPTAREIVDANANVLAASYSPGTVTIALNPALTLSPLSLASGTIGRAYSQTITASGGTAPYSFAVSAGALPPGLSLAAGGALSGTPTQAGGFPVTITATDASNRSASASYTLIVNSNLQFYPLARPIRLLDTRPANQRPGPAFDTPGAKLAGVINGGVPRTELARVAFDGVAIPPEAQAVVGTATAFNYPAAGEYAGTGNVTFYPSAANRPEVSNLNYAANQTVGNAFTVGLSSAGAFDIFVYSDVHLVIDIVGYYAPPGAANSTGLYYHPLAQPIRLLETRSDPIYAGTACNMPGAPLTAGSVRTQPVRGTCAVQGASVTIPANAQAVLGNLTAVNAALGPQGGLGAATVFSSDLTATPVITSLSYDSSQTLATAFAARLGGDGAFKLAVSSTTDFLVDIVGYFSPDATDANGTGLLYTQLAQPIRLLDTRPDFPACDMPRQPLTEGLAGVRLQPVRLCNGASIIPESALTVTGNATVVNFISAGTGNVTLYPGGTSKPEVSTLNYAANQVIPNAFTVGLNSAGAFNIFTFSQIHFLADLTGYFAP